jgi:hypothetical protein
MFSNCYTFQLLKEMYEKALPEKDAIQIDGGYVSDESVPISPMSGFGPGSRASSPAPRSDARRCSGWGRFGRPVFWLCPCLSAASRRARASSARLSHSLKSSGLVQTTLPLLSMMSGFMKCGLRFNREACSMAASLFEKRSHCRTDTLERLSACCHIGPSA